MKKIVIIPGVGFHEDGVVNTKLYKCLINEYGSESVIYHNWAHKFIHPTICGYREGLLRWKLRSWLAEVIFDFQQVVCNIEDIEVPNGTHYIGHSAGSILALKQSKPTIIFGSPTMLIGEHAFKLLSTITIDDVTEISAVLNIVNRKDPIAYPIYYNNVENWTFSKCFNPATAHRNYWNNKNVCNKIVDWLSKN